MKTLSFNQFINESDEQGGDPMGPEGSRLRDLGLAPDLDWRDRYSLILEEWNEDPEVDRANRVLRKKVETLLEKYKTDEDDEYDSDFQQWVEFVVNENTVNDVGLLEYLIIGEAT